MRRLFSALLLAAAPAAFFAPPALAYDSCLGAKVNACLDAIKPYLTDIDYRLALQSVDKYLAGDIAGRRKAKGAINIRYHSRFAEQFEPPQIVSMDFSPSLEIDQIDVILRKGAGSAETEAEY